MRITREAVLEVLGVPSRPALSEKALLRALAGRRDELAPLRLLLKRLVRDGVLEHRAGRFRAPARHAAAERGTRERAGERPPRAARSARAARPRAGSRGAEAPRAPALRAKRPPVDRSATTRWVGLVAPGAGKGRSARLVPYRDETPWSFEIGPGELLGARAGQVVVAVTSTAPRGERPRRGGARGPRPLPTRARVVEVLGRPGDPEADFQAVVWRHGLRESFPPEVIAEADALPEAPDPAEIARRLDLRDLPFVTIDPATARDHDDAVCVETLPRGGARLRVAIADVSHFVSEGSALDREALRRGNSVYFPDRAIPMLPHRLSGDVCSLRAGVDRPVLVVELDFDADAVVRRRGFHAAVIRSAASLVYEEAADAMEGRGGAIADPSLRAQLESLAALARRLTERRKQAGALDFELPAAQIVLDEAGRPCDVVPARRTIAHRAIEEAMLAANRAVAERLEEAGAPAVYRIHESPDPAKLEALGALFERFGLLRRSGVAAPDPREIADALRRAAGLPEERLLNLVALRSMKQARYHEANLGHFALAFESYLHFTSPIRRYADLVVHRALRGQLDGAGVARPGGEDRALGLARVAEHLSAQERVAVDAERDITDLKRCVFLRDKIGEEHDGTVTGVAPHGFYVTLDRWLLDGLVHATRLPRQLALDESGVALVAPRGGPRWQLGDRVRVRIESVDVQKGWVSLALAGGHDHRLRRPTARRSGSAGARRPRPSSR
ncbi:MAG TPA: VacB/RNase II family 3'-5' exoribonuclease [Myxococcota bacterium]|jgi:ribonuclease R|nr:VacB/RNase II family 3'-5' exoribonuclease [Myxococcota bacterium]